jgi:hypothetical protein
MMTKRKLPQAPENTAARVRRIISESLLVVVWPGFTALTRNLPKSHTGKIDASSLRAHNTQEQRERPKTLERAPHFQIT